VVQLAVTTTDRLSDQPRTASPVFGSKKCMRSVSTTTSQCGVLHVLAPNTGGDLPAGVGIERGALLRHRWVEPEQRRTQVQPEILALAFDASDRHVHRGRADEAGDEDVVGVVVPVLRVAGLLENPGFQQSHPVAHRHRLGLVVRHVDGRDVEVVLHLGDLGAHLHPQLRVEVGQRLVNKEHLRLPDDGASHRNPLPLAAGELLRLAVQQRVSSSMSAVRLTRRSISALSIFRIRRP
jgi:hypothetical protein